MSTSSDQICLGNSEHFRKYNYNNNNNNNNNNNLLLGSSITKSGLHRGPKTRYILHAYNDTTRQAVISTV